MYQHILPHFQDLKLDQPKQNINLQNSGFLGTKRSNLF